MRTCRRLTKRTSNLERKILIKNTSKGPESSETPQRRERDYRRHPWKRSEMFSHPPSNERKTALSPDVTRTPRQCQARASREPVQVCFSNSSTRLPSSFPWNPAAMPVLVPPPPSGACAPFYVARKNEYLTDQSLRAIHTKPHTPVAGRHLGLPQCPCPGSSAHRRLKLAALRKNAGARAAHNDTGRILVHVNHA